MYQELLVFPGMHDSHSFVSSSADGTVHFYKTTDRHSHLTLNMVASTCGAHVSPFSPHLVTFGTTQGRFYVHTVLMPFFY